MTDKRIHEIKQSQIYKTIIKSIKTSPHLDEIYFPMSHVDEDTRRLIDQSGTHKVYYFTDGFKVCKIID